MCDAMLEEEREGMKSSRAIVRWGCVRVRVGMGEERVDDR